MSVTLLPGTINHDGLHLPPGCGSPTMAVDTGGKKGSEVPEKPDDVREVDAAAVVVIEGWWLRSRQREIKRLRASPGSPHRRRRRALLDCHAVQVHLPPRWRMHLHEIARVIRHDIAPVVNHS